MSKTGTGGFARGSERWAPKAQPPAEPQMSKTGTGGFARGSERRAPEAQPPVAADAALALDPGGGS